MVRVDAAVADKFGGEALRLLALLGIAAALATVAQRENATAETRRQAELALTQSRYEADLARRQDDAPGRCARTMRQDDGGDPANRLVAGELERRWNDRLAEVPDSPRPPTRRGLAP